MVDQWISCSRHALCKVQWSQIAGYPQCSLNAHFSVDLPTIEVPRLPSSGQYNSFQKR